MCPVSSSCQATATRILRAPFGSFTGANDKESPSADPQGGDRRADDSEEQDEGEEKRKFDPSSHPRRGPAGSSEAFFRDIHRLIHSGKVKQLPPKGPRAAIYAALLYDRYPDEIRATGALNVVFKALTLVGKTLRFEL